jgi:hypothetical protein
VLSWHNRRSYFCALCREKPAPSRAVLRFLKPGIRWLTYRSQVRQP